MTAPKATLDTRKQDPDFDLAKSLTTVTSTLGKSPMSQVSEITRLTFGNGKLTAEEYFNFHLYDDSRFSFEDKKKFLGMKAQKFILPRCNPYNWWSVPHDKLVFYGLLAGLTYAVPVTQAIYHPFRCFGDVPALRDPAGLADFLRHGMHYPCFGKPVAGIRSVGVSSLESYESGADVLVLSTGSRITVDDYVDELSSFLNGGYIFQERLVLHPRLQELCGDRIATVRMVVLLGDDGPEITHALWKIPAGDNIADNFWRNGNLLASLDVKTGQILRVVRGFGIDETEVEHHPDTGERLIGAVLPDWQGVTGHCLACAAAIPGLKMQAWDIAIGPKGPIMVEVNIGGDFNLPQIATGRGLMEGAFAAFLEKNLPRKKR